MPPISRPDERPLLTFYGDDFTGSTDALEAVASAGLPAMLFLRTPTPADLARYPGLAAVGVAGTSRSRSPAWMDTELPATFRALQALGAPFCHYKTCSTFDSAPHVGNIGRAAEIGQDVFGGAVMVVVGVPRHQRFVVFSTLFAAGSFSGSEDIFRIDRHPTMRRHPVTPMDEADLRLHLARQTTRRIVGFDFRRMLREDADAALAAEIDAGADMVILDGFDAATMQACGRLLASRGAAQPVFLVGSSGVEYALAPTLVGMTGQPPRLPPDSCGPAERLVIACGSCSPVTERQIAWAEANGFALIAADTAAMVARREDASWPARLATQVTEALRDHAGVVLHTARGGDDPRLAPTREALQRSGLAPSDSASILGGLLGQTLREVIAATGLRRVMLAGGDSSSHTAQAMGIEALEMLAPLLPGAPLCRIRARDPALDGVEIVMKGGQVGGPDCFGTVLNGHAGRQR
ncbi:3-oxo-isoapionate kinase [Rhodovastum atsumiense]|uniref:Four-carbon acid sugar kinase family protein n=1 Tax=Rhodovastum atsumiense TaxID=504468 RepID=A0A5M6IWG1_9PROT|nr:four-carbon acid sugar kinase family protein [Rhodovastum atsumiense]KAA5612632.1 four-carbon acid sugar kinase family protein [Rhodovastum atsumiense]CAH2601263.1 3-oxo-isoapionate kinase [Rhodovastum atsumiense]